MEEKDFELVSIWSDKERIHSNWSSRGPEDLLAIVEAIADFAIKNDAFLYLLLGTLADCVKGGKLSRRLSESSVDISNFNDILKNTKDNG